jgi:hypothetical protein
VQDLAAEARGQIAQSLIELYRALGGGWEMRLRPQEAGGAPATQSPFIADPQRRPELPEPQEPTPAPPPPGKVEAGR